MFTMLYEFIEDRLINYINKKYKKDFKCLEEIIADISIIDIPDSVIVRAYNEKGYETFDGFDNINLEDEESKNIDEEKLEDVLEIIVRAKELFISNDEIKDLDDWLEEEYATLENISSFIYTRLKRRNLLYDENKKEMKVNIDKKNCVHFEIDRCDYYTPSDRLIQAA